MKFHPWIIRLFKRKERIYILPTKMGGYLNGLIFLMFLLSVGYSNNLLLIFTLFLFGLNLIWVIQTHYHLHNLKLESINLADAHALEKNMAHLHWKKAPEVPHKWELSLEGDELSIIMNPIDQSERGALVEIIYPKRGFLKFTHLRVRTEMPFGLYQAWIYMKVSAEAYAYPAKLKDVPDLPAFFSDNPGEQTSMKKGSHDIWNLGPYQGEESRKISWKHYARTGELVVKEGEELTNSVVHFKLPISFENKEYLLSKLATQMVKCARSETPFSFEGAGKKTAAANSSRHLHECLKELARC